MIKNMVEAVCGTGKGKTSLAVGKCLKACAMGKSAIVIQFLKGNERGDLDFLQTLDSIDIKIFRFERQESCYSELSYEEQQEEKTNILNGLNFARKVIATRECDFLVLDELLGLIEKGIASQELVTELLGLKDEAMQIMLTGDKVPEWLYDCVESVTTLTTMTADE
ncbi:MAG: cob(I)yrinic acid a,c-diamide adenosyltransferase [Blautia sp.]|nr:cob(I)yrinic acid a,c-diamide adenosyltransferase [Blautia sp.]